MFKKAILGISSLSVAAVVGLGMAPEASAGSAPPLTSLDVVKIESELGGVEYVNPNNLSTVKDHGGSYLYIYTREIGYGYNRTAKMNGTKLKEIDNTIIDLNRDRIIDGWTIRWDGSGHQDGRFEYQNSSTNYPWNKMYTAINIR
ncbi:DUF4879 domain-containing protein [Bacillus sp. AFS075034]|uniref:DUF4879 domain-containing protein n=1 Tax=Bacillus sp. AFS075034 TaxID=2034281 RepID=UPI000BF327C0|nr:DUF4879 domain-containing protein [Bacillus sp. AFS075034]PFW59446.1 DUF4879 domain-containing protein [Bacillus sp. AFS075034]